MSADEKLIDAANTYKERNKIYGNNYLNFGPTMVGMFPDGLELKTPDDFIRFHLLMLDVVKTTRYCNNFADGGHADSIHDKVVYCAMLEHHDEVVREKKEKKQIEDMVR